MPEKNLELIKTYQPENFQDRGVAVAFTSPMLSGARVRKADHDKKNKMEIIVPNPSGGRGVYIMPWSAIEDAFNPSLHDHILAREISSLEDFSPTNIRKICARVTTKGSAGRLAQESALMALNIEKEQIVKTNSYLISGIIRATDNTTNAQPNDRESKEDKEKKIKSAIQTTAKHLGASPETIMRYIEKIAALLVPVGVGLEKNEAYLSCALIELIKFCKEVEAWSRTSNGQLSQGKLLAKHAAATATATYNAITEAINYATSPLTLLRDWHTRRDTMITKINRADWLLDGWPQIIILWKIATETGDRIKAMDEIIRILPFLPTKITTEISYKNEFMPTQPQDDDRYYLSTREDSKNYIARNELIQDLLFRKLKT